MQIPRRRSKARRLEQIKRINLSNKGRTRPDGAGRPSVSIEVLDTLTNKTIVYPSIIEAARGIGCVKSTIQSALKFLKEKGVTRLIKKRYSVKHISASAAPQSSIKLASAEKI